MTWALPAGLVGRAFENIGVSLQCGEGHSIPVAQVWLIQPVRWLISSDAVAQKLRAGSSPHPIFAGGRTGNNYYFDLKNSRIDRNSSVIQNLRQ